jgi:cytochrome c oxidase cbb3-type subunit III
MRRENLHWVATFAFALFVCLSFYLPAASSLAQEKSASPEADAAMQAEAKQTFETVCAACHGLDAHGSERGPDIASRPEVVQKTDKDLLQVLVEGRPTRGMPSFSALGADKLSALVAYLRTLQGRGKSLVLPGDPERGKALFFGKARCSQCHALAGHGGFFASDLSTYSGKLDAGELRNKIISPDADLDPRRGLVRIVLFDGSQVTGSVRNENNFSIQLQSTDGNFHLFSKSLLRSQNYLGASGMPLDYASTLNQSEIDDLISLVIRTVSNRAKQSPKPSNDDDDDEN